MFEHKVELQEHFIKYFENVIARGGQTAEHERLVLQFLPKKEKIAVVEMFFSIKDLFKTEKARDIFSQKNELRVFRFFSAVNPFMRKFLGVAIFVILLCAGFLLAAAFFESLRRDPGFYTFTQLGGYLACLALIYF